MATARRQPWNPSELSKRDVIYRIRARDAVKRISALPDEERIETARQLMQSLPAHTGAHHESVLQRAADLIERTTGPELSLLLGRLEELSPVGGEGAA